MGAHGGWASQPRRVQKRARHARLALAALVVVDVVLWAAAFTAWTAHERSAGRVTSRPVAHP